MESDSKSFRRRQIIKSGIAAVGVAGLAGCQGGDNSGQDEALYEGTYTLGENSIDLVSFQMGLEEGIWFERGFDLEFEISAYPEWARTLSTGDMDFGGCDQMMFFNAHRDDVELVFMGSNQMQINAIFVRPDSDIEAVEDLVDRPVGVPFLDSATTTAIRGILLDEYDINLREDTDVTSAAPPVLWQNLQDGEIDAMVQFSGETVRGYANPDDVRPIFDFNEYWVNRTGHTLQVVPFAARKDWLENNYDVALEFVDAHEDALEALSEEPADVYQRYGQLAGLNNADEVDAVVELFNNGQIHPLEKDGWTDEYLEAQWEMLDLMALTENVDIDVPSRDEYSISYQELSDLAEDRS